MTPPLSEKKIGFLGLGIMGTAMAQNLLTAGYDLTVFNRSPEKATPLKSAGATVAVSPAEVGRTCDIVFSCVTNNAALEELLFGATGLISDSPNCELLIDMSTVPPEYIRSVGERLEALSIHCIDAPVSGGDVGARNGTLTIMAGGTEKSVEATRPLFDVLGSSLHYMGALGNGQLTKAANQIAVALSVAAMTEALSFVEGAGLDKARVLKAIRGGAAGSWSLENYAPRVLSNDLKPGFYAKDMLKDLRIALAAAEKQGSELPASKLLEKLYSDLCETDPENNLGNHGLIALYRNSRD